MTPTPRGPRPPLLPGLLMPCLLLSLSSLGLPVRADSYFDNQQEFRPRSIKDGPAWVEGPVTLPPWPRDADLIAFVPDGPERPFRFFVDGKNLKLDSTGKVVRYTVVIEAPSGVRNVSFEGIHCSLRGAYKVYAYGSNGQFAKASEGDWRPIDSLGNESWREDLRANRFCVPREISPRPMKDILRSFRGQGSPKHNTGFQAD